MIDTLRKMKKINASILVLLLHVVSCDDPSNTPPYSVDAGAEHQAPPDADIQSDTQVACTPSTNADGSPVFQNCQGPDGKIGTCFQNTCCLGCLKFKLVAGVAQLYECQDGNLGSACGGMGSTCDDCGSNGRGQQCLKSVNGSFACFQ